MRNDCISYTVVSHVIDSWAELRRQKDFEERAGSILFRRLFMKCPSAKVLFGFPMDMEAHSEELLKSRRFLMHARYLISMIDTALNMLGPDFELLKEIMMDLGKKHVRYGVKPEYFPLMGEALIETLNETLTDKVMTAAVQESWLNVYAMLSANMIEAM
jgi:hemoglobin-like flavoprotein